MKPVNNYKPENMSMYSYEKKEAETADVLFSISGCIKITFSYFCNGEYLYS